MTIWAWTSLTLGAAVLIAACTVEAEDDGNSSSKSSVAASSSSSSASAGGGGSVPCEMMATYEDCAQCLCDGDEPGCTAHLNVVSTNYFCGQTCMATCGAFCMSYDDADIDPACDGCASSIDCQAMDLPPAQAADCMAASQACQADPACEGFLVKLQMCPEQ